MSEMQLYEATARRFAEALKLRLGDQLHAVVLYGSVAKGTAHDQSDIDLLVVAEEPDKAFDITGEIAYELDFRQGFQTFTTPLELSPDQLENYVRSGDPFLERVLGEGRVLYDDGTLARLQRRVVATRS